MKGILIAAAVALFVSIMFTPYLIRLFSRQGFGQEIREEGPKGHAAKRGTPTMGGVAIVVAMWAGYVASHLVSMFSATKSPPTVSGLLVLLLTTSLGLVGFLDDFIKIRKQRSLGLTKAAKFAGQALVAVVFGLLATHFVNGHGLAPASTHLSFTRDYALDFGTIGFVVWAYLMVTATSNRFTSAVAWSAYCSSPGFAFSRWEPVASHAFSCASIAFTPAGSDLFPTYCRSSSRICTAPRHS